jgi:hypothetical protein
MRPIDFLSFPWPLSPFGDLRYKHIQVMQGDREFTILSYSVEEGHVVLRLKEDGFNPNPANWAPRKTRNLREEHAV